MSSGAMGGGPARWGQSSDMEDYWHSRGYLPHWEGAEVPQHITFGLYGSVPRHLLDRWQEELSRLPESERAAERRRRIEEALDAGHGECWLRRPEIAGMVQEVIRQLVYSSLGK